MQISLIHLLVLVSVAFLNTGTATQQASSSFSASFSVTASGTNRCAFAPIEYDNAGGTGLSLSAVQYNGVSMTSCGAVAAATSGGRANVEVYAYPNPPTGSNTLAITGAGGVNEIYANLVVFTGVDQTTPARPGTYQNATGAASGGHVSMTISSNVNDLTLSAISGGAATVNTPTQTSDGINNGGNLSLGSDHATTAAASVTHDWTCNASAYAMVGFSIQAASSGTTQTLSVSGATGPAGTLVKQTQRTFTATQSPAGALLKMPQRSLGGSLSPSAALTRSTQKPLGGAIAPSGTLIKQTQRRFTAAIGPAGTLTTSKVSLAALAGAIGPIGTLTKRAQKALVASVTPAGSVARMAAKQFAGAVGVVGTLVRRIGKAFAGALGLTGAVSNNAHGPLPYSPPFWRDVRTLAYPRSVETRDMRSISSATRRFPGRTL